MTDTALADLKVVEFGGFIAAPYCTKLLAQMGAEVIKIEDPGNVDPSRRYGPFSGDEPHIEGSLLFAYLNTSKKGITLDVRNPSGKKLLKELFRDVDVLVESNPPKVMTELGLDYQSLKDVSKRLIVTSITPFGQTGPYQDYKATDMVSFHIGGVGYATPGDVDDPDTHPPLKAPGHQADFMAGLTAATASMTAIFAREITGRGQHVDVSEHETLVRTMGIGVQSYVMRNESPTRIAGAGVPVALRTPILAKDGYFTAQIMSDNAWASLKKVMGYPEWMELDLFANRETRRENTDAITVMVEEWSKNYTREEIYRIFVVENHIPSLPVNTIAEVTNHPHFQERKTFVELDHPYIGKFKASAPPFDFPASPWRVEPAPTLGEHNEEIFCERLGYSREELVRLRQMSVI